MVEDCSVCKHYFCKILWSYLALIVVAVVGYFIFTKCFFPKTDNNVEIALGMMAWTVAMIVPLAANFAITDWRDQQRIIHVAQESNEFLKIFYDLRAELENLQYDAINISNNLLNKKLQNNDEKYREWTLKNMNDLYQMNNGISHFEQKSLLVSFHNKLRMLNELIHSQNLNDVINQNIDEISSYKLDYEEEYLKFSYNTQDTSTNVIVTRNDRFYFNGVNKFLDNSKNNIDNMEQVIRKELRQYIKFEAN